MWIWLLAALICAAAWVLGYFLEWALWLKLVLTGVAVLMVVVWLVVRHVRAKMKARSLERELLRQAEQQALNARPDRRAEILELQVQMQRGLEALRRSRVGKGGGGALYTLPWYMIIGPPGAGKTTALKQSGLGFPFADPQGAGGGLRGVGGTRNCDWWFTNEAILLDTAGRWATQAEDGDEWLAFLDMLRKYRSRKPINGVLVAISVTDLLGARGEELESYAKRLRARFDEITTRLEMIVPVYVLFTKMDLVAGFVESWGDLSKTERGQIWGMTFSLDGFGSRDAAKVFDEEFDTLVSRLQLRALKRIAAKRQPEVRQKVYQFPIEFAGLKGNLRDFLGMLLQPNSFQETPILRGVYFTSGTQEGRPIDRVLGEMRRAYNLTGLSMVAPAAPAPTEARSYFLTDIFRKVVFPDQLVASRTRRQARRQLAQRAAISVATIALGAFLVFPSLYTSSQNLSLVRDSRDMGDRAQSIDWGDTTAFMGKVKTLDPMRARVDELEGWNRDGVPLRMRWNMYAGDVIREPLRDDYAHQLQLAFANRTRAQLEKEINGDVAHLDADRYPACFGRLKVYLEMTEPPRIEHDPEIAALTDAWARSVGVNGQADKDELRPHVAEYVQMVSSGQLSPWRPDPNFVNRVRTALSRVPEGDRFYSALVREANDNLPPIRRANVFVGTAFESYVKSRSTPEVMVLGAFTRPGWEQYVRDRLDDGQAKFLAEDRWVLGEEGDVGVEHAQQLLSGLRDRYFVDYRNAWAAFLRDLDVRPPENNAEALSELTAISENPSPYAKLLGVLDDNTHLALPHDTPTSALAQAAQPFLERLMDQARQNPNVQKVIGDAGADRGKPWVSPVEVTFRPMVSFGALREGDAAATPNGLSHYLQQIVAKLIAVLTDMRDTDAPPDPQALEAAFRDALRSTSELLSSTQSGFTYPLLSPLLLNPIRRGYQGVLVEAAGDADKRWQLEVWQDWHDKLEGRYPFADAAEDATLADYAEFFRPDKGLLWAFYNKNLATTLERHGDVFAPAGPAKFLPDLVKCFQRGWLITGETFPENSEAPAVEFDVNVHSVSESVSEVTFEIDGVSHGYKNTPEEWFHVRWPSKDAKKHGASLRMRGFDALDEQISRPGDFGLFRLLDAASAIEAGAGGKGMVVMWNLQSQRAWVRLDIRPMQAQNVFSDYLRKHERTFRNYRCPRDMAAGVR